MRQEERREQRAGELLCPAVRLAVHDHLGPVPALGDAQVGRLAEETQLDVVAAPGAGDRFGVCDGRGDQVPFRGEVQAGDGDGLRGLGGRRQRLGGGDGGDGLDPRLLRTRVLRRGENGGTAAGGVPGEAELGRVDADAVRAEPDGRDDVEGGQQVGGEQSV